MAKIFISYRRDDLPDAAARVRDALARPFGKGNVFLDVDHLLAGQRFDEELAKALSQCDVLIAMIGPRWMELLRQREKAADRDYVREEIAAALQRRIVVIPVRAGRDGALPPLPRAAELPEDIRDLVHYQKHDVTYERFPRDIAELIDAIHKVRRQRQGETASGGVPWWAKAGAVATVAVLLAAGVWQWGWRETVPPPRGSPAQITALEEEIRRRDVALARIEAQRKADDEARARRETEARQKAEADAAARAKAATEAEAKRVADAAAARKADEDRQRAAAAEAEAKRKAEEEARARAAAAEAKRVAEEQRQKAADLAAAEERRKAQEMSPGRVFRDCNDGCPEMVVVPAGSFTMGSNDGDSDEKPPRTVTIRQAFAVGKFEVTVDEYEAFVRADGYKIGSTCFQWTGKEWKDQAGSFRSPGFQQTGKHPATCLNWNDAKAYVVWLSRKTGQTYRLLTEAEWEYAARARGTGKWTFGDDERRLGEFGWYSANAGGKTQPVGGKTQNAFGLHDMHGNVWEWVEDCWHANYSGAPSDGSAWTTACADGNARVVRGGSWSGIPGNLRSAIRDGITTTGRNLILGLRVARVVSR